MLYDTRTDASVTRRRRAFRHSRRAAIFVLITCAMISGCGSRVPGSETDPASSGVRTADGPEPSINALGAPVPANAVPYDDPVVDEHTTTQSFELLDLSPGDAIEAYPPLAEASGWTTATGPSADGLTDYTLTMTKDNQSLLITTAPADTDGDTELSLEITAP